MKPKNNAVSVRRVLWMQGKNRWYDYRGGSPGQQRKLREMWGWYGIFRQADEIDILMALISPCRPNFEAGQACVSVCYLCLYWINCSSVYGYSSVKRRYLCRVETRVHDHGWWSTEAAYIVEVLESDQWTRGTCLVSPDIHKSPVVFGSGTKAMQAHKSALHAVLHQCSQRAREYKCTSCDLFLSVTHLKG